MSNPISFVRDWVSGSGSVRFDRGLPKGWKKVLSKGLKIGYSWKISAFQLENLRLFDTFLFPPSTRIGKKENSLGAARCENFGFLPF